MDPWGPWIRGPTHSRECAFHLRPGHQSGHRRPTGLPDDGIAYVDALVESTRPHGGGRLPWPYTSKRCLKTCLASTPRYDRRGHRIRAARIWRCRVLIRAEVAPCRAAPGDDKYVISAMPMRVNSARSRVTSFTLERAAPKMDFKLHVGCHLGPSDHGDLSAAFSVPAGGARASDQRIRIRTRNRVDVCGATESG